MTPPPRRYTFFPYTTLFRSMEAKFITGDADLDEDWDDYLETLKSIGIDDYVNIYQAARSEEHTSELQSRGHLVCRRLLERDDLQMPGCFGTTIAGSVLAITC